MSEIKFYGGVDEIGGNRILVKDRDTQIFLDFGMSFSKCGQFFEEYLKPRYSCTGLKDLISLRLLHFIEGIYRPDLLEIIGKTPHTEPSVQGVFLSHIHQDHSAYISLLDPKIPIYCSATSEAYAKAAIEAGKRSLETEVYNFKQRPLVDYKAPATQRTFRPLIDGEPVTIDSIQVKPFPVDHSVPGAMAFLINTSDATVAYTGDLRLHGTQGHLTERFVEEVAKEDVDILLCEGTRIDQTESTSENYVAENSNRVISKCDQLVVADFAYKDLDRFLTFYEVARSNDRKIVISRKHAYLLNELRNVSGIRPIPAVNDENILIYIDRKETGLYRPSDYQKWEQKYLDLPNAVKAEWLHDHQNEVVTSFTFFDMNELIDVEPNPGSVCIHSASEPHNEEQVIDEQRFNCWLDHFSLQKHHFHASGHASRTDIKQMIETIKPKKLIPIHTEKPTIFARIYTNVEMPKLEPY